MKPGAIAVALSAAIAAFPAGAAEEAAADRALGTTAAPGVVPAKARAPLGTIAPANVFRNASYGTGGVGLRNRLAGGIEISGSGSPAIPSAKSQAAFLYWAVITEGTPPAAATKPSITRRFPLPAKSAPLTGSVVGTGAQPCWAGDRITVYKASVPNTVATGNGLYDVVFPAGASGSSRGGDPWTSADLPLLEGASLVVVGRGTSTVAIYDRGLSGGTAFGEGLSYTLTLPTAFTGSDLRWDNIGADGQHGTSREAHTLTSNEVTEINGQTIAGPGSPYNDSDWNGGVASPLPLLWDDTGHDLRGVIATGATSLNVVVTAQGDCITPVANVLAVR